jgi:uncharacterized Zn finger protein (UPF0148 family)
LGPEKKNKHGKECPHCKEKLAAKHDLTVCPYCGLALVDEALEMSDTDAEEVIDHLRKHEDWA